jgi:hypothetical protein
MIAKFFDALFGCSHNHYSFPRSAGRGAGAGRTGAESLTGKYVVCLDCGKEMPYDWESMKVVSSESASRKYLHGLAMKAAS